MSEDLDLFEAYDLLDGTTRFHKLSNFPLGEWPAEDGSGLSFGGQEPIKNLDVLQDFRRNLQREEFGEYIKAEYKNDLVEIVDGCLDMIVIAWGTLLSYIGEDKALEAAREVLESNLSKVDGRLGPIVRRADGKILKPEGWQPPNIAKVLGR